MDYKILEVQSKDGLILAVKYFCALAHIQTEGWWFFGDPVLKKPFEEVKEADVIEWVKSEAGELIESNLRKQLEASEQVKSVAPWLPQTFTPSI